ncbi:hypothetical protein QJS66_05740 [Kocuria rhizophila]|nr:hypothetical protein QJS66_05740 [Kocuria rhizophila]
MAVVMHGGSVHPAVPAAGRRVRPVRGGHLPDAGIARHTPGRLPAHGRPRAGPKLTFTWRAVGREDRRGPASRPGGLTREEDVLRARAAPRPPRGPRPPSRGTSPRGSPARHRLYDKLVTPPHPARGHGRQVDAGLGRGGAGPTPGDSPTASACTW